MRNRQEAVALIQRAFEMAREAGKPDWVTMTLPVLKNRLLSLTDGRFHESDYGARTVLDFAKTFPDVVSLDEFQSPPVVTLLSRPAAPGFRVRADLWRAVMDYSSERRYVWDRERQMVCEATEDWDQRHRLPTITPHELREWREQFVSAHLTGSQAVEPRRAKLWIETGPTRFLPRHLQGDWNRTLASRVEDRLRVWFRTLDLTPPHNLVEQPEEAVEDPGTAGLRAFVLRCVTSMTEEELKALDVPASALFRMHQQSR